jgi:hypothetical protein
MVTRSLEAGEGALAPDQCREFIEHMTGLLIEALQKLSDAGEVDAACRIAGRACVALRRFDPASERRFNALLHRLARRLPE